MSSWVITLSATSGKGTRVIRDGVDITKGVRAISVHAEYGGLTREDA